jgi:hypothetical protein
LFPVPIEDSSADHRGQASTDKGAFEVPGIYLDLGHLDAAEVIRPVPVAVEESATDQVSLVDDRAVDLEHDQQPVCRVGRPEVGGVPGLAPASSSDARPSREPYRAVLNER